MSNKKELNVNELSKVSGGVGMEGCNFKYNIEDIFNMKATDPLTNETFTAKCKVIARGVANETGNKFRNYGNHYYLTSIDTSGDKKCDGWISEDTLDSSEKVWQSAYYLGINLVDGSTN